MDNGLNQNFTMVIGSLDAYSMITSLLITDNIISGRIYRFRYRVMNINGFSEYSDVTYIQAAVAPGRPASPKLLSASAT